MYPQSTIDKFLNIPLDDWSWIKECSRVELQEKTKELTNNFQFSYKPFTHQYACFLLQILNNTFLNMCYMGLGKTLTFINTVEYKKKIGDIEKVLILTPNVSVVGVWLDEIKKHSKLTCIALIGKKEQRLENLNKDVDIYIMNYDGLESLLTEKKQAIKKKKKVNKSVIIPEVLDEFCTIFDTVIYDEIQKIGVRGTLSFDICSVISKSCMHRYGLTGTPVNRDLDRLWSVFYLIDLGKTFGYNISIFRQTFLKAEEKTIYRKDKEGKVIGRKRYDHILEESMEDTLHKRLQNSSVRYAFNDVFDMPKTSHIVIPVKLPYENRQYLNRAKFRYKEVRGDFTASENCYIKMRQICAGFLGFKNEDQDKVEIKFDKNYKLDVLVDLIKSTPSDSKILVFNVYTPSGDLICERLKKEKITFERLYGKTKNKIGVIDRFKKDPKKKVFVINAYSGGSGLNLPEANYTMCYESPVEPIDRQQLSERMRPGTNQKKCFIYDLVVDNSVDEDVMAKWKEGKRLYSVLFKEDET